MSPLVWPPCWLVLRESRRLAVPTSLARVMLHVAFVERFYWEWETIAAIVLPNSTSEIDVKMKEIAENLHRADLTKLERAEQITQWISLKACRC